MSTRACEALASFESYILKGPDAARFLQGQCTADLESLPTGATRFAAHCNPKGRVISLFLVARLADDQFALRFPKDIADTAVAALQKYLVFSKATLSALNAQGFMCFEPSLPQTATPPLFVHHYGPALHEFWLPAEAANPPSADRGKLWHLALIERGIVTLQSQWIEKWLPQELNLDQYGAVSFKKGCYTGQEVIARLHYKGKLKKHLRFGYVDGPASIAQSLWDEDSGKRCGEIIDAVPVPDTDRSALLALADDDAVEQNRCVTDVESRIKIEWQALSYAIP